MSAPPAYDLVVIGAGPAGTTLANLVARAGHRVLLVEARPFPRYQIGESLLPATFSGLFPLLGIEVDRARLGAPVLKRGATFHWGRDESLWTLNFGGAPDDTEPGPEWPTAFNVRRDVFDEALLDAAQRAGAEVRLETRAVELVADEERVRGVRLRAGGRETTVDAHWVAGADGQGSLVAAAVGQRQPSAFFRNAALFGYFRGAGRLAPPLEGNVLLESFGDGWAWFIPLDDELTSVGVVLHAPATARLSGDREALYRECLTRCRYTAELLAHAARATDAPYAGLYVRSEFSYTHSRLWRAGALAVGDAACFVDVILSSGVHLATYGALQAARAVNTALAGELPERLCMNEFELRYRMEFTRFYQGLLGLHDMQQDGRTYRAWLREMLRQTQGVRLDEDPPEALERRDRTWRAIAAARRQNAAMVAVAAPPPLQRMPRAPELVGELLVADDGLHYARDRMLWARDRRALLEGPVPRENTPLYDYGKLYRGATPYACAYPAGLDGALNLVNRARERGIRLRVRGSGHTFSGASLPRPGEVLVRSDSLDHYHFMAEGTLLAGAGALVWDIRDLARDHGFDLPVFNGGWAGPTLGGYISAGGFGKSGLSEERGGLWENVRAVRLVDGQGELRRIARGDDAFRWLFGSSGQLGLLVDAELDLVPYAAHEGAARYPFDQQGRIPRRQVDDPRVNDLAPPPDGARSLFWFTLLVAPEEEDSGWDLLHGWVLRHRDLVTPDGGWAGPEVDDAPIGYRYIIRFREFTPPLVYPRAETFHVIGVMCYLVTGTPAADQRVLALESDFVEQALARRLHLYLQAENIGCRIDREAYYGARTYADFAALRRTFDPAGLFNRGVVFPDDAL